ncbi:MAG: LysR family transcriptional regulator [Gammaproteobacteria bacterium]|nr:LysR family transcriptional regulator [Gammaproteobacteria bacterium]MCF6230271.1 LysR family transcriptional regulator [Gammaproteobacteria bacterium]
MQYNHLTAFIAVAKCHSFSRASEQLFLSQSAISKRVAALELSLRCQLFDRIGHKVTLTAAGNSLLPRAYDLISRMEDCQRVISNLSGKVEGRLNLGTSHHIGIHYLPAILKKYTQQYPNVELKLHFMESEHICSAVAQGEIELGIATLPDTPAESLTLTKIWDDTLVFVCGEGHPLNKNNTLSIEHLAHYPAILPPQESTTYKVLQTLFTHNNLKLNTSMESSNLETIKMMVSINLGWSLLPKTMLSKSIVKLVVKKVELMRKLGIINHRERSLSNAASRLITLITAKSKGPTTNNGVDK